MEHIKFIEHCVKSVQIRTDIYSVHLRYSVQIQENADQKKRHIRTRKNSVFGHFSRSENYMYSKEAKEINDEKYKIIHDRKQN